MATSLTTLARPYAKAAFEVANESGKLAEWGEWLAVAAAVAENDTISAWLRSPDMAPEQFVEIVADAADGDLDETFGRFLGVLAENDRLPLLPEVTELYGELRAEAERRLRVRVVSAIALEEDQAERLKTALAKRFERDIELHNEVRPEVLGGAIVYAGDEVIDGSLKGRLERLQNSLS